MRYLKKNGTKFKLLPVPNSEEEGPVCCVKCGAKFDNQKKRRVCMEICGHETCYECLDKRLNLKAGCEQCARVLMPPPTGLPPPSKKRKQQVIVLMPTLSKPCVERDEEEFPEIRNISLSALPVLERADENVEVPPSPEKNEEEQEQDRQLENIIVEEDEQEKDYAELKPVVLEEFVIQNENNQEQDLEPELIDLAEEEDLEALGITFEDVEDDEDENCVQFEDIEFRLLDDIEPIDNIVPVEYEDDNDDNEEMQIVDEDEEEVEYEEIYNTQMTDKEVESELRTQMTVEEEEETSKSENSEKIQDRQAELKKLVHDKILKVRLERLSDFSIELLKNKLKLGGIASRIANLRADRKNRFVRRRRRRVAIGAKKEDWRAKGFGTQICQYCSSTFMERSQLGLHLSSEHHELRPYPCDICNWPFDSARNLAMHKLTHTNERPYKCTHCDSAFNRNFTLKKHMDKIHGLILPKAKRIRLEKPITKKIMESVKDLTESEAPSSEKENLEKNGEEITEESLATKKRRYNRRKLKRKPLSVEERFCCSHCDRAFSRKFKLGEHLLAFHADKRPYSCDLCGWSFAQKNKLQLHRITHTIDRPFKCKQCESTFNRKYSLERHIRIMHLKKPRDCEAAENKPSQKKSQVCPYCHKQFECREVLGTHMKTDHGEKRPYICNLCQWPFARRKHLVAHIKTHSEEKPHHCRMCDSRFNRRFSLERHMDHVHGVRIRLLPEETPLGEEYCPECQSLFDDKECVKVAYSKCGHISCIDCVIRAELGCGECTTETANVTEIVAPDSPMKQPVIQRIIRVVEEPEIRQPIDPEIAKMDIIANLEVSPVKKRPLKSIGKDGQKVLNCRYCDYTVEVRRKKELGVHMAQEHLEERPYPCNVCQWPFTTLRDLERHELIHTNEKPFKCDTCKESFNRKSTRDRHVEKKHLNWRRI